MKKFLTGLTLMLMAIPLLAWDSTVPHSTGGDTVVGDLSLDGNDILDSSRTTRLTVGSTNAITGHLTVSGTLWDDTLAHGSSGVALSTANSTGNSEGILVPAYVAAWGTALTEGDVVIATTAVSGQLAVMKTAGTARSDVIGVATASASTGTVTNIWVSGFVLAHTTGTITEGDVLVSTAATPSGAAGYLAKASAGDTATSGQAVGIAVAPASAGGLTKIKLLH